MTTYNEFLARKAQLANTGGFEPTTLPGHLFDYQHDLVEWAVRQGRAGLFADCGLGKTPMELAWADQIHQHTGKPVLLLTPLAVGFQIAAEADKFGHDATLSRDGQVHASITITNYEQLHRFDPDLFGGVVCDESSILKNFDGATKAAITEFMRRIQYRLLGTATAAPNDYIELGTSSEALGHLGYMDMLTRFFVNDNRSVSSRGRTAGGKSIDWRLKGHAEEPFWQWVSSWGRAIRRPSDYGFSDDGHVLPDLVVREHLVEANRAADGVLFDVPAHGLREEREENRRTLVERCEAAAAAVATSGEKVSMVWCNLNDEGDLLERLIPRAIQVKGSDSDRVKEKASEWFVGSRCICNDPDFGAKLARWDGSRSTPITDVGNTTLILPSEITGRVKAGPPKRTGSTCASTTSPTPTSSSAVMNSGKSATESGVSDTPPTSNTANGSSGRPSLGTHARSGTQGSESNTESELTNTSKCSPTKAVGAPFAASSSETPQVGSSQSTTVTKPARCEDSSVGHAIKGSESSATIPTDLTAPGCMCGHIDGRRRLVSKSAIYGWGLNFQHCNHMTYFPTHSYESWYQAVRRCWRFGQLRPVTVDVITTEGGSRVLANLQRKAAQADEMFSSLVAHMNHARDIAAHRKYDKRAELPTWLTTSTA